MNELLARLRDIEARLDLTASESFGSDAVQQLSDDETAELLTIAGRIRRRLDGIAVEATDVVVTRSDRFREERMTTAFGCAGAIDLVRMLMAEDARSAARLVKAAKLVHRERGITDGAWLPPRFPALRAALADGAFGVAGLLAATEPIVDAAKRLTLEEILQADDQLAVLARGIDPDRPADAAPHPTPLPEDLSVFAKAIGAYLDQDGPAPLDEEDLLARRFLQVGALKNGVHPVRGALLPEAAAQLGLLQDSILNPKNAAPSAPLGAVRFEEGVEPADDAPADTRTRAQRLHDAFATILTVAAGTDLFPHLGGAAPTLVVTATAEDLARGAGWATLPRTGERAPLAVALQAACAGGIQRVLFDDSGRIASLGTSARIFNALQRRAITLRDGGCIIPGCTVPASWCEIHHVTEHAAGGPTHTDNGVLLCWFHHRTLHLSNWLIRFADGMPEVRGPAWWDPHQHWHRARSPHRRLHQRAPAVV
ncbi:DUF222 domain-containing protein [Microbacterium sp. NPDC055903]